MIRVRLLIGFVLVALLPILGISIATYLVSSQNGRQQSIQRLESVAARKELAIQVWGQALQQELQIAARTDYSPKLVTRALSLSNEGFSYSWYNNLVRKRLQLFVDRSEQISELFLVDLQGEVIVSTTWDHGRATYTDLFRDAPSLALPHTQLPRFGSPPPEGSDQGEALPDSAAAFVLVPVAGDDGALVGAIGAKVRIDELDAILDEQTGLGNTGTSYLVNWDHFLLVGGDFGDPDADGTLQGPYLVHAPAIDAAIGNADNLAGTYSSPAGNPVVGIYRWLPDLSMLLVVEQDASEAFAAVTASTMLNASMAAIALALAVAAALYMTRNIADPIADLARSADRIARGDLKTTAPVLRDDEVGALARAFNSMTAQLRNLIDTLEQRVAERTQALQVANEALRRRALQMETTAKVGRQITSIVHVDVLLAHIVDLIQDSFGYYHVRVFLLDRDARQLILRAGSGLQSGQHQQLDIGGISVNGMVARTGQLALVSDVREAANYLADPGLPETQSELVIPLRVGDQVTGTLDVLSSVVNAFSDEDVVVMRGLADQIAVAIANAHHHDQSKQLAVLEERHRLARELHDSVTQSLYSVVLFTEGWRRTLNGGIDSQVEEYLSRIGEITQQSLKEMRLLIHELRPPALGEVGLVGALQKRLDAVEGRVGIDARVFMDDFVELAPSQEEDLYRIANEALNNTLKHGHATRVVVRIWTKESEVNLEVTDNGVGFDMSQAKKCGGMGLAFMGERAKNLGGMLSIRSAPRAGAVVRVSVPLTRTAATRQG